MFAIKTLVHGKGGAERVLSMIANEFSKRGNCVQVITFDNKKYPLSYSLYKEIEIINLSVGDAGEKTNFIDFIKRVLILRKKVLKESPDIVIPFMHSMFIPMSFSLCFSRIPVVASEHHVPRGYKKRKYEFLLFLISSFFVKRITVLSDKIKQSYPWLLRRKMFPISNPVYMMNPPKDSISRKNIFLSVGRLDEQKDYQTLIKAFDALNHSIPSWELRIYGEGKLRQRLTNVVLSLNLQQKVFLMGTTDDIHRVYQESSIFVSSSYYESFGLAVAEAMSSGLPCVGFQDCPGINEVIVHEKNGLLAKGVKNHKSLASCMKELAENASKREYLGNNGAIFVKKFDIESIYLKWEALVTAEIND